jgi:hypothetical protein
MFIDSKIGKTSIIKTYVSVFFLISFTIHIYAVFKYVINIEEIYNLFVFF